MFHLPRLPLRRPTEPVIESRTSTTNSASPTWNTTAPLGTTESPAESPASAPVVLKNTAVLKKPRGETRGVEKILIFQPTFKILPQVDVVARRFVGQVKKLMICFLIYIYIIIYFYTTFSHILVCNIANEE